MLVRAISNAPPQPLPAVRQALLVVLAVEFAQEAAFSDQERRRCVARSDKQVDGPMVVQVLCCPEL